MTTAIFGKPETGGVVFAEPEPKPAKREVHITGYVTVEIIVDMWIDVEADMDDEEIKREALEDLDTGQGSVEYASLNIEGEPTNKILLRHQRERERQLLEAWNRGEPIKASL